MQKCPEENHWLRDMDKHSQVVFYLNLYKFKDHTEFSLSEQ